ncbi:MAG: ClbS/DfsB family four-helix bundle protein [Pseudomonadota bacterium]
MPAATNKADLIAACETEFAKLSALVDRVPGDLAMAPDEDGLTIRDVLGHRAHWIDLYLGWRTAAASGRPVHLPAEGWKWSELVAYNAQVRAGQAGMTWAETVAMLRDRHRMLIAYLAEQDDAALYGAPMEGHAKWTPGRFAEASGASHYRSAAKLLRARLKAASSGGTA